MLREKARASLQVFCLAEDPASMVTAAPIASRLLLCPRKRNEMEWPMSVIDVVQNAQLRRVAILEDHFEASVVIDVGKSEGAAVLKKIQARTAPETSENVPSPLFTNSTLRA